jgi:hypothetical protein
MAEIPQFTESFRVEADLGEVIDFGVTSAGHRRVIPVAGGRVSGSVSGSILPSGADYQVIRPDGVTDLEARYVIAVNGGGFIYVQNRGYRTAAPEDMERLLRGEPVDPSRVYFRTSPRFETSRDDLRWLERSMFVGLAERMPTAVRMTFFKVE